VAYLLPVGKMLISNARMLLQEEEVKRSGNHEITQNMHKFMNLQYEMGYHNSSFKGVKEILKQHM
jgi:hypothetical protein